LVQRAPVRAFEVAQNFYEQLRQERLQQQRQTQLELAQKQLEQIQAQVAEGVAARVDIQSVQVTVSQSRFDLVTTQNALRTAAVRLRNALGLPAGPPLKLQSPPENEASEVVVDSLQDSLALAKRLSPDLVQVRANILNGESTIALAKIEARPQISATAGYDVDPRAIGNRGLTASLGVSIPIFNGGGRRADVRAATFDTLASRERLAQLEKDIATDVEATHTEISGQVERLQNARELVASAQTNLNNATEKYRVGLGIALDIVNAQSQLFDAQTSVTQARFDLEIARANFDRAVGRFAWAQPGQAPPTTAPTNHRSFKWANASLLPYLRLPANPRVLP
jgi:outer membrane protein